MRCVALAAATSASLFIAPRFHTDRACSEACSGNMTSQEQRARRRPNSNPSGAQPRNETPSRGCGDQPIDQAWIRHVGALMQNLEPMATV